MRDPNRWRNLDGGADAETRALLRDSPLVGPSRAETDEIWASLSAQVDIGFGPPAPDGSQLGPAGHGHGPVVGPVAAAAGTGALAGKATLAVVLLATVGGVVGARVISSRDRHERVVAPKAARQVVLPSLSEAAGPAISPEPQVQPPAPTIAPATAEPEMRPRRVAHPRAAAGIPSPIEPSPAVAAPVVEDRPLPVPAPGVAPQEPTPAAAAPVSVNELLEEGRRLDRARVALRAQDPDLALRLLGEGTLRTTELAQEREALTIEALASKPALRARATERARIFMQAYPNSPYRARIKAIVFESR